ncbi:hypothetical protein TrLO_g9663 [Triparma laevis f. longispina]|uniref:Uncharacterized protein n=1 Tax=Triparma laevis f. longispina TaxID=1714387 RepID=A0A9W7F6K2_9STRA|nr:hypothetical protein TrLO_g9663 [Triparma laevis f. longispina]
MPFPEDYKNKKPAVAAGGRKFGKLDLKAAVKEWCEDSGNAEAKYGHVSWWDTSEVTSMLFLFSADEHGPGNAAKQFNDDISRWNVDRVEDSFMFSEAESFSQDLSDWDVEKCKDITYMLNGAKRFNKDSVKKTGI